MFKGTLLHEMLNLPRFWYNIWQVDRTDLKVSKHKFGHQRRQYYLKVSGPKSVAEKIVLYFHGGGWMFGTPEQFLQNAQVFTHLGYTVYMPSYRRLPYYQMSHIKSDLLAAIEHLSAKGSSPITNLMLSGMSAGGHLAALLALDPDISWRKKYNLPEPSHYLGIGAPLDLSQMRGWVVRRLAAAPGNVISSRHNPIDLLTIHQSIKIFLISAGKDGLVPYQAIQGFSKKVRELNLEHELHHSDEATHMEIALWSIPGTTFNRVLVEYLRQI